MVPEEELRQVLAEVESQRDDAIAYLGTIRSILDLLARPATERSCAREIARILMSELVVESCAVVLRHRASDRGAIAGFATQAERFGQPSDGLCAPDWLELATAAAARGGEAWFVPGDRGTFVRVAAAAWPGESVQVIPFSVGGEARGAILLHRLTPPTQRFALSAAIPLIADTVGQALTIAHARDAAVRLGDQLAEELGSTRQTLDERDQTLRSREESIARLGAELVRSNRAKREFLSTISHELRTPLNAIIGYASLLREEPGSPFTTDQADMLDGILTGAARLTSAIDDILLFVQIESDRVTPAPAEVDLERMVDEVVAGLDDTRREGVALRIDLAPGTERPVTDSGLLQRILFHLVSNALKFTDRGEVAVRASMAAEHGGLRIEVRDTGMGIPPERVAALLELFSQADSSTSRRHDGLGLGLCLVQRLVALLGGHLSIDSEPGAGTSVRVVLPRPTPGGAAAEPPAATAQSGQARRTA